MESYEVFIQKKMSHVKSHVYEETSEPEIILHSSNIKFYGVPVLPPLLNKDQKEEMQRLRESATHLINKRKCSSSSRVSCVQNILDSVQLRKAPTFEEFKDETETSDECDVRRDSYCTLPVLPAASQIADERVQISLSHPMTSTAYDGHAVLSFRPLDGKEDSLENSHTTVLFEGVPVVGHKPEQYLDLGTDDAFDTLSLPQSYQKHPQIDVSHQGLSSGYVTIEPSDVSSGWIVVSEGVEERCSDFGGFFLKSSNSTSIISHAPIDGDVLEEEHTLSSQAQIEEVIKPVNASVGTEPPEDGPYQMSLQNLLKKSQEHRRRQRMLRNQAKALKDGEALVLDECNFSDKENEEFFSGGTVKSELKRIREKKRDQGKEQLTEMKIPNLEIPTQIQGTSRESLKPPDLVSCVGDIDPPKCEVPFDRCLNSTSSNTAGSITGKPMPTLSSYPKMADSPNQSTSATASPSAKSLYQSKSKKTGSLLPRPCQTAGKKINNVPTPKFCLSPVRSKKGSGIAGSFRKPSVKTPVCVDAEAGPNPCGQAKWASSLPAEPEGDVPACRSTDQAEQIAQLELNLSSLKVLISDLESTLSKSMGDFNPAEVAKDHNSSQQSPLVDHESISLPASDVKPPSAETVQQDVFAKDNGTWPGSKQQDLPHCVTSMVQRRRVPEVFRAICSSKRLSQRTAVLTDASNQPEEKKSASGEKKKELESIEESLNGSSLNRSYDVDTPSRLWSQSGPKGKQLTPELGSHEGVSRAKRRLLMNNMDGIEIIQMVDNGRPQSSTPNAVSLWPEQQVRLEQVQVRALMEEQRRHEQKLLQSLATRYQFLRSVSFPCPSVGSRLEDVATSLPPSSVSMGLGSSLQPSELTLAELSVLSNSPHISQSQSCFPVCHRPLVAAAVKGYLARRLLRTERVAQLIRTIKDTQLFLQDSQCHTPGREFSSRQDRVLEERVTLQLRSARYELHDLFFSLCPADRMQVISWDRQLAREREFRHKKNKDPQAERKSKVSAATRKALERKRTVMLQKKSAERSKVALGTEDSWTFVPNPCRVPKKATPLRRPR